VDEDAFDDKVLDYAKPPLPQPPLRARDVGEYYREPPSPDAGIWLIAMVLVAVVSMILFCAGVIKLPIG